MGCETCPLNGNVRVQGRGRSNRYVVVGDSPSQYELSTKKPFAGTAGAILRQSLQAVGLDPEETWLTSVTLCSAGRGQPTPKEAIEACHDRLIDELQGAERVLVCGANALSSLFPAAGKVNSLRGIGFPECELPEAVVTYHPAAVLSDPFNFTEFARDVEKFASKRAFTKVDPPEIRICSRPVDVKKMIAELRKGDMTAIDIEASGLDPLVDRFTLVGFQCNEDVAWQVPGDLMYTAFVRRLLKGFLEDSSVITVGHNIGFDTKFFRYQLGIDWRPQRDTMLLHYLLDERSRDEEDHSSRGGGQKIHGLKTLARERYNADDYDAPLDEFLKALAKERQAEVKRIKKETGEVVEYIAPGYGDIPIEVLSPYLAYDTLYTYKLAHDLHEEVSNEGRLLNVHDKILIPAALALKDVELTGVQIDVESLLEADRLFAEDIEKGLAQIREYAGDPDFNVNSTKQVAALLYDTLKLKAKTRSTDAETLNPLVGKHPAVQVVLDCRQKERLRGTYIKGLIERLSADGRLRGEFLLHGTQTGRLSSRNPNLQNIPVLVGPVIRNAFMATPGWTMIEADYSQLELRMAAVFSGDKQLSQYYHDGVDVHRMVASEVFGVPPEQVTQMQRYIAKYIDFGIIYGRQAASLANNELKCSVDEAQRYLDSFLAKFPGLRDWMHTIQQSSLDNGYVEGLTGRRRRFPLILDSIREEIKRRAVNTPIQGTASDVCLTALTRLHNRFDPDRARILLTVHDSILIECRDEYLDETLRMVHEEMEDRCPIESPIKFLADVKTGRSWGKLDKRNNS